MRGRCSICSLGSANGLVFLTSDEGQAGMMDALLFILDVLHSIHSFLSACPMAIQSAQCIGVLAQGGAS